MRRVAVIAAGLIILVAAAAFSCAALRGPSGPATPEEASRAYFRAWSYGDFSAMRRLVDDPPGDFADRHRALSHALRVDAVDFTPGRLVRQGDEASVDYGVTRHLTGVGDWSFRATLRLARRDGAWRVLWSPATLHPALVDGGALALTRSDAASGAPVAADGRPLPDDSGAQPYLADVGGRYGEDDGVPGWVVQVRNPGRPARQLKVFPGHGAEPVRTTIDRRAQAAADAAVGSASAALVAIRPSTGEIVAVSDRLPDAESAFQGLYPPGSTFKVVVAAALLDGGMTPASAVDCPAVTVAGQRTIHNHGGLALGRVPLADAFAESCNTTFAKLGVAAGTDRIRQSATAFGFGAHFDTGTDTAYSGDFLDPGGDNGLAEASIGQGRVQATPLAMAVVAAAVADGSYRPPRMVPAHLVHAGTARPLPSSVVGGLRSMMRAVATRGTAAHAGLPAGTAGKTGTAEYDAQGHTHAWFIGYRGDLAFAVFVLHGGDGGQVAGPVAARFLALIKS
ncbi:penicillin-binding transpeptidase domain-containing protein [Actinoallomurus rhizosphaericola]|uniref:penicillin-binding transpeptidase domain-containing protein n=1 Tax=Actinoallomurus rhizosphaericola TaxID=2952536 RepID=UPI0020931FE3|nr:penicillin-binding transpeptidase domain-containing protein [Actinoallomurus rhizosphaericola]MCO5996436.1 penicillin-binding transpeptidase domain-containing protein [Actinoallomurus rhizosphaericola]